MLDSVTFLKSLVKASSSPVGMPEAMLEWVEETGYETIGIFNGIGGAVQVDSIKTRVESAYGVSA
jgi:hypothetical protein